MIMRKRIAITTPLLLLATSFCHARSLTESEANTIIVILLSVVLLLVVLGIFSLRYNRIISRRNEQLLRILNALDDYRTIVANGALSFDEQEDVLKIQQPKSKAANEAQVNGSQAFYVKMDARINKEKPFTDPGVGRVHGSQSGRFLLACAALYRPQENGRLHQLPTCGVRCQAAHGTHGRLDGRHCRQVRLQGHSSLHQRL